MYILINPLLSHHAKKSSLRKVKTEKIDACRFCELYYKEELEPYKKRGINLLNLRHLTRQHETLTGLYVQAKLQFHAILDQYRVVFGDLYSKVSLNTLLEFSTSESVLQTGEDSLTDKIANLCISRSERWAKERAKKRTDFFIGYD
jgi:transposase